MKFIIDGKIYRARKYKQKPRFVYTFRNILVQIDKGDGTKDVAQICYNWGSMSDRIAVFFENRWYSINDKNLAVEVKVGTISREWVKAYEKPRKEYFREPAKKVLGDLYVFGDGGRSKSEIGKKEDNDCTVISMAHILGASYDYAHSLITNRTGRISRKGVQGMPRHMTINFSDMFEELSVNKGTTVVKFSKENPDGRYLILTRGHSQCVIDGKIYDNASFGPLRRILRVYKLKESYESRNTN